MEEKITAEEVQLLRTNAEKERKAGAVSAEKERKMQEAMLQIKKKYGKNAILKGTNFLEGATTRDRNAQIGGHKA